MRGQLRPMKKLATATAVGGSRKSKKQLVFPFTKIQGQDEMKMPLLLNVVDPNIGGVLIMGDRGTAKSVAVSGRRGNGSGAVGGTSCARCARCALVAARCGTLDTTNQLK